MKNDVVRWSAKRTPQNSNKSNEDHYVNNNNNKLYKQIVHNLSFHNENQHENEDKTTSHNTDLLQTIAFNKSSNQSVKCDTNVYDLYLVQNIVNSSRYLKKKRSHKYFNHFFDSVEGEGGGSRRSSNNIVNNYGTRLLFLLQLSVLFTLCSFNIGFVTSANVEINDINSQNLESKMQYGFNEPQGYNNIDGHYTHTWAVHIPDGDKDGKADTVARDHGFINLGKVSRQTFLKRSYF